MEEHINMMDDRSGKVIAYSPAKAARGLKFNDILKFAEAKGDNKTIEHLNSLPAVVSDIKYFKDSKNPVEKKNNRLSETELKALTKDQQIIILNKLGITNIPRYEADRVKLIMEKQ